MMNGHRKSDNSIVPGKWPNNARGGTAGATEGRGLTKGNTVKQNVPPDTEPDKHVLCA